MDRHEFLLALTELHLAPKDAAKLLGYDHRTIKRWQERGATVPPAPAEVLRAWVRLQRLGLPWRPGAATIGLTDEEAAEQLELHRQDAVDLIALLRRVEARGGPAAPWRVDLPKKVATLGEMDVYFHRLANGGFSLSSYSRTDKEANLDRDMPLIEDAAACITEAIAVEARDATEIQIFEADDDDRFDGRGSVKFLDAYVRPAANRLGWVIVEGFVRPLQEDDGPIDMGSPLRPQPGNMREIYLHEVLRKKARERGCSYVVIHREQ